MQKICITFYMLVSIKSTNIIKYLHIAMCKYTHNAFIYIYTWKWAFHRFGRFTHALGYKRCFVSVWVVFHFLIGNRKAVSASHFCSFLLARFTLEFPLPATLDIQAKVSALLTNEMLSVFRAWNWASLRVYRNSELFWSFCNI